MNLVTSNAKISTAPDGNNWGGCFAENGLYILLEVSGDDRLKAPARGKEVLDFILTEYTNITQHNPETTHKILQGLHDKSHIKSVIIAILDGDRLYMGGKGSVGVIMKRNGKIGKILEGEDTSVGQVQANDQLLFSSGAFDEKIKDKVLENLLSLENIDSAAELVVPYFLDQDTGKGIAALLLQVKTSEHTKEVSNSLTYLKGSREKISEFFVQGKRKFRDLFRDRFERPEETKSKKTLLTVSVILIILLTMSIFFNLNHEGERKRNDKLTETLNYVSHQYDEAINLIDLNPVRARMLLSDSKLSLSPLLKEFPKNSNEYKKVEEWLNKILAQEITAYKIFRLTAVPLFFDLNLTKPGAGGTKLAVYKETKVILDTASQSVYSLSTDTKQSSVIAGSETVKDAKTIALHGQTAYVLNSEGIVGIDLSDNSSKVVVKRDDNWGEIISLVSFGGNLYLLDKSKHTIWKYIATDFGFSAKVRYLNPDVRVDFSEATNLAIDGSVWVLTSNGVQKFTKGLEDQFVFKDFSDTLTSLSVFSTSDIDKGVYILDKILSRIVIFSKDGDYQSQYQWSELKNADDIIASEEEKKIFVLIGSKIYAIEIK